LLASGPRATTLTTDAPDEPRESNRRHRRRWIVASGGLVLAMFMFSAHFVAGRHGALAGLTSRDLVALRYVLPGLIFVPLLLRWGGVRNLGGVGWMRGVTLTLLGGAPYVFLVMVGVQFAPGVHATVITPGFTPTAGAILARAMLGEPVTLRASIGIPVALAGVVLVAGPGLWSVGPSIWLGDTMFAAASISYALYTVLLRRWQVPPLTATAVINVLSAGIWLPAYAALSDLQSLTAVPFGEIVGQAILQGVLTSVAAVLLYVRAVHVLGASQTSFFFVLVPVFGTLLAAIALGERVSAVQGAGIAAVGVGMVLATFRRRD
jgi:drug/metabolite transporter (DMT)-like permease